VIAALDFARFAVLLIVLGAAALLAWAAVSTHD
jgi:hypothetical protein